MKNNNRIKNGSRIPFILFATMPALISFLIFYVGVNFSSLGLAFTSNKGGFTLDNFVRIYREFQFESSTLPTALKNTLLTFAILLAVYPLKVLVSYFIYKKIPFSGFYRVIFFLPMIIFPVCLVLVFQRMIGPSGFLAKMIGDWLGLDYVPELLSSSDFANATVLLHMLWLGFPGDLIIWGGTFSRIPNEVLEAGQIDGVSWWTEFTKIIVPLVWPTVALQMVLMFCSLFSASGQVFLLTEGQYGTETLSSWMYKELLNNQGVKYHSNVYNYLSAIGLVITAISVSISMFIRRKTDKIHGDVEF